MFEINKGKIAKAQKVVIYGVEGVGKSTLASKFPDALFIDFEGSTNNMNVERIEKPSNWKVFLEILKWVKTQKDYKTLIIDTADFLEEYLCKPYVVATIPNSKGVHVKNIEEYGYGAGYKHLGEVWGKEFLNLASEIVDSGVNVVLLAHATQRKVDLPDSLDAAYDRYELKLEKKTAALTKEWADLVLFANYKTNIITINDGMKTAKKGQGQKRMMYASHHAAYDAKNRHGLPDEMTLEFKNIEHIFENNIPTEESTMKAVEKFLGVDEVNNTTEQKVTVTSENKTSQQSIPFDEVKESDLPTIEEVKKVNNPSLRKLMDINGITYEQIQKATYKRGYYPEDMPIENYDPRYVEGVLIGAFEQIKKYIEENNL